MKKPTSPPKTVLETILDWSQYHPAWQRDPLRRIAPLRRKVRHRRHLQHLRQDGRRRVMVEVNHQVHPSQAHEKRKIQTVLEQPNHFASTGQVTVARFGTDRSPIESSE